VVGMSTVVLQRLPSERPPVLYEPFRESARWLRSQDTCRGQAVAVLTTDRKAWYKPGFGQDLYAAIYGRYLDGFAQPRLVFMEDLAAHRIDPDLAQELRGRLEGQGCPVLAWSAHNVNAVALARARTDLLRTLDGTGAESRIRIQEFRQGDTGYALYVTSQRQAQ